MLISRQVTIAAVGDFAATAQLRDHRLARPRRTSNAHQIEGGIVQQAEVGAAAPTGRCSVRCRLEHSARTLSSAAEACPFNSPGSSSEMNMSVPV